MMFEVTAFKFYFIHIKHQTFNFKHTKRLSYEVNFRVIAFFLSYGQRRTVYDERRTSSS